MPKENKNYALRSTPKPAKLGGLASLLSTTVAVFRGNERYYCYVSFSDKLVTAVGKALPQGVSPSNPAYLIVQQTTGGNFWRVNACYIREGNPVLLWTSKEQPAWLKFYKVKKDIKDGSHSETPPGADPSSDSPGGASGRPRAEDIPANSDQAAPRAKALGGAPRSARRG